jgi:hypothetical protein
VAALKLTPGPISPDLQFPLLSLGIRRCSWAHCDAA